MGVVSLLNILIKCCYYLKELMLYPVVKFFTYIVDKYFCVFLQSFYHGEAGAKYNFASNFLELSESKI